MELLVTLILSFFVGAVLMEVSDRRDQLVKWITSAAARLLPYSKKKKNRFAEEWAADALATNGRVSSLLRAMGCFGAATKIVIESKSFASNQDLTNIVKSEDRSFSRYKLVEILRFIRTTNDSLENAATAIENAISNLKRSNIKVGNSSLPPYNRREVDERLKKHKNVLHEHLIENREYQRQAYNLRAHGKIVEEIADELGVTMTTAEMLIARGLLNRMEETHPEEVFQKMASIISDRDKTKSP